MDELSVAVRGIRFLRFEGVQFLLNRTQLALDKGFLLGHDRQVSGKQALDITG